MTTGADSGAPAPEGDGISPTLPLEKRQRPAPLDLAQALPLVERALEVLERRAVQPQLGLLKSTMLQLSPVFNEKAYGARSFSEFVEKLKAADFVKVSGSGGRYIIERKSSGNMVNQQPLSRPEDTLPTVRDVLEMHRLDLEDNGAPISLLEEWIREELPSFEWKRFGFQELSELLNFAQDRGVARTEPSEEHGLMVYLGAEFYPPAGPPQPEPEEMSEEEEDGPQPHVRGQPSFLEPNPKPEPPPTRGRSVKRAPRGGAGG